MGRALGSDLRNRVLKASSEGLSARQAAIRFEVAASTAIRWIGLAAKGESAPRIRSGRPSRLDAHRAFRAVSDLIESDRPLYLFVFIAFSSINRQPLDRKML